MKWFQNFANGFNSWRGGKWARYLFSGLIVGLLVVALIEIGLAWGYIWYLMHPDCPDEKPAIQAPAMEIWLQTPEGAQLRAWYSPTQNGAVIITLGGLEGALGERQPPARFLSERGFGVLQIDSRACAMPPLPVTLGAREAEDVAAALEYLQGQRGVEWIGVFGYSMGGAGAIRAAAKYPEIAAVVAEGGYFNLGEDIVETDGQPLWRRIFLYAIAGSFWLQSGENPWGISPIDDLPAISPRPVLLIYGEQEADSGRAEAQYSAALEPRYLWIVPGGDHGRNHQQAPREYEQRVLHFFEEALLK